MTTRRTFVKLSAMSAALFAVTKSVGKSLSVGSGSGGPLVLSTWQHGLAANEGAWKVLGSGGHALDAVEQGVMVTESDIHNLSVGLWGLPDRDGHVTLDACIMDEKGRCGSVCFLEHIKHPISVARMVMEKTPHIMLVGEGAQQFALANGFKKETFDRSPEADAKWKEWLKTAQYHPDLNIKNNHDTIGMIALDSSGNLSGSCTTSGLGYKMRGRVGDSPVIGAGLFVDNEVGAATATGVGEEVIRIAGTHTIVEMMRAGHTPEEACRIACERIKKSPRDLKEVQVGFIAINKHGETGAYSLRKGLQYAEYSNSVNNKLNDAKYLLEEVK